MPYKLFHKVEELIKICAEGQLRLHHPELGQVPPSAAPLSSESRVECVHLEVEGILESCGCFTNRSEMERNFVLLLKSVLQNHYHCSPFFNKKC